VNPEDRLPLHPRDYVILLLLARGDCHGYGIIKRAEARPELQVRLDPANLYRTLRKLERQGLVEGEKGTEPSEGAPRRVYGLTDLGGDVVRAESARLARLADTARAWRLIPDAGAGS
jgi:PadR family transcriptional regulator PadR